jgi:hypothetical protein
MSFCLIAGKLCLDWYLEVVHQHGTRDAEANPNYYLRIAVPAALQTAVL